jgi:hypothetical protein
MPKAIPLRTFQNDSVRKTLGRSLVPFGIRGPQADPNFTHPKKRQSWSNGVSAFAATWFTVPLPA